MKLEEYIALRAHRLVIHPPMAGPSDFSSCVVRSLGADEEKYFAQAPGCLDVLGGIAEYAGALVLAVPLGLHACAAAQRGNDGMFRIRHHKSPGDEGTAFDAPLNRFLSEGADSTDKSGLRARGDVFACCVGTVIEAMQKAKLQGLHKGLSLAVGSDLETVPEAGLFASIASAVLVSILALEKMSIPNGLSSEIVQTVQNRWLGMPAGPADTLCALHADADCLAQLRCDNRTLAGSTRLSPLRVTAIDTGTTQQDHAEKYQHARTATFMGRMLIERIIRHDGFLADQWDGHLSRISVNDFVERLRDRLPPKIRGKDFLKHFGDTSDPLTRVHPELTYKVRSRTEHHIYEHARSWQFAEAIARGVRNSDRSAFIEAGRAMNASQWSLGQRCGITSPPADYLVNQLKKADPKAGIYGARVAGRARGRLVAVLAEDSPAAYQAIEDSIAAYVRAYNLPARVLGGSIPGALVGGATRV